MLSKFPSFYIQRFAILLMSGLVITAGVFTLGNAEVFDRIFIGVISILIVYFRNNKNIACIFLILLLGRVFEEIIWITYSSESLYKIITYAVSLVVLFMLKYDVLAKLMLVCLACICMSEVYWYVTEYDNTPDLPWYTLIIMQDIVIRHLLFMRPAIFSQCSTKMVSLPLDFQLYNLSGVFVILYMVVIYEYFVRHIFQIDLLVVFKLFPYLAQITSCAILWTILNFSLKRTSLFRA
jgi:hypothetical protein